MSDEWKVIHAYTRRQAIADGTLIDVTAAANGAGFRVPVALTRGTWTLCVQVPRGAEGFQDETGRLHDVLMICRFGIRKGNRDSSEFTFRLSVVTGERSRLVTLKAVMGPDDNGGPCLTIMLPEED